jgi:hypothetical protein
MCAAAAVFMSMASLRPRTTACRIRGPIAPTDLGGLAARVRGLIRDSGAEAVLCDLDENVAADLVTVDALARLQLEARRLACGLQLRTAPSAVEQLLEFAGLVEIVSPLRLRVEPERETEQRKELRGLEEERELADAPT